MIRELTKNRNKTGNINVKQQKSKQVILPSNTSPNVNVLLSNITF